MPLLFSAAPTLPNARPEPRPLLRLLVLLSGLAAAAASGAEPSATSVAAVQKAVSDWAKVRQETVRLESTWETERQLLHSTLKAMQERAQTLAEEKKTLAAKTAGERTALTTLAAENAASQAALDAAAARLAKVGDQLAELRPSLPPRLSRALDLPYRSLSDPKLSPGERMQFIMTILNRCAQFNGTISYDEEPLALPGETGTRLLEVIYWGASHAYALDRSGGKAYLGVPGGKGWAWEPLDAVAPVTELIAIYREKSDPHFVEVPARLRSSQPN